MSYFKPLGEYTGVRRIVACNPAAGQVLIDSHVTALRNGSGLPSADKACIAACVSGLNACHCCYGVHAETTKDLGVEEDNAELYASRGHALREHGYAPLPALLPAKP